MEAMEEEEVQGTSTNIDLSLDDIIKLQKEESDPQPSANQAGQQILPRRNFGSRRFFRGPPRNQQGPGRSKPGFKQQRFPRANTRNAAFGPVTRQRAAASFNGVSPLLRPETSTPNAGQARSQKARQITKNYRASPVPVQMITRSRNNSQNRTLQFRAGQRQQRTTVVNENRRQFTMNRGKEKPSGRRWQNIGGFGTTLTVSVSNPKANRSPQDVKSGVKPRGNTFRKPGVRPWGPPPKGVPLRFNFRAMANHTNVTLNDRFSTLRIKGQFAPSRRGGRTVTLA